MSAQNQCSELNSLKRRLFKGDLRQLFMGDHILTEDDARRVGDAYWRLGLLALDVSQQLIDRYLDQQTGLVHSRQCSIREVSRKISAFALEDTAYIFKQFKCLLQALRHLSDNDRPYYGAAHNTKRKCFAALRRYVKSFDVDVQGIVWEFIQPYFSLLWIIDTPDIFRYVNDLVQYISRLTLSDVTWIEEENIDEYVAFEERLHNLTYDPDILAELCEIVTRWFSDFDLSDHWADHGYGATAEVNRSVGTTAKYHAMIPTVETALLARSLDWVPANEVAWKGLTAGYENILDSYLAGEEVLHASDLICKVQLVPKGCDKKRVVSKEPTCHQFYQKMIGSAMSAHFDRHPGMRIDLHDQELNRRLAKEGSSSKEYATIDLSSASDSVTLTLFRALFYKTPVYDAILHCRTTKAELSDGRIVELEKMSPMGSAVCFPIECTVFSSIVALANKRLGVHSYYRVYGDDLVVHYSVFDEVISLLEKLNFLVNKDKSFAPEAPFKESCGIECYHGTNVSPIRLSRKYDCIKVLEDGRVLRERPITLLKLKEVNAKLHNRRTLTKSEIRRLYKTKNELLQTIREYKVNLQLDSLYKHGNDALLRGYLRLRASYITDALAQYKVPVFSHSEKYGFLTLARNVDIPNAKIKFVPDSSPARKKGLLVRVIVSSSRIEDGSQEARYSKLLEEYDRTNRCPKPIGPFITYLPEDRLDVKAGSAYSDYTYEWVPYSLLQDYE